MSLDGPRRWATRHRGTARHRAAAGRAKSSGLTWILQLWVTGTRFRRVECTVHATTKRHRRQVRSVLRRQSGAWLPTRQSKSIFLASNGLQRRMNDPLAQRLSQALGSSFTLEGEIGRGGMGVVYHARDERLKRRVAVKVLPPELAFREEIRIRFLREAETAARLSHPHIVPIHSVGEGPDGLVYFVMAYVDGESVAAKLKRRGQLPSEEARRIMLETADALGAAHALGIIHRDVKPDNILLEGSRGRVVVTDFGIAKALSSTTGSATLTATGVAIGTPHYMSPEQAAGDREIDGRSDIYSLGVVSYQMLTGELPFHAPTVPGILMKHIMERAPLVTEKSRDCPEDLAACVMRSLEKDPEDRWPTADALRRALEARSATMSRPRRSGAASPSRAVWLPPPAARPALPSVHRGRLATRPLRRCCVGRLRSASSILSPLERGIFLARRIPAPRRRGRNGGEARGSRNAAPGRRPGPLGGVRRPDGRDPTGTQRPQGDPQDHGAGAQVREEAAAGRDRHGGRAAEAVRRPGADGARDERRRRSRSARTTRGQDRCDEAGAREPGARAPAQPAAAAAADAHRPAHAPPAGRRPDRVVRARDAERAVRSAAPQIGGRGRRARRSHPRHSAGARLVPRRRPRHRRGRRDPGSAGGAARRLGIQRASPRRHRATSGGPSSRSIPNSSNRMNCCAASSQRPARSAATARNSWSFDQPARPATAARIRLSAVRGGPSRAKRVSASPSHSRG